MKDVNVGEKDRTIRKLIDANRQLKEELEKEMERYLIIENKHKELLVKFNVLAKEHKKFEEMVFTQTTGGKMANFQSFLASDQTMDHAARTTNDGFNRKYEEDLY